MVRWLSSMASDAFRLLSFACDALTQLKCNENHLETHAHTHTHTQARIHCTMVHCAIPDTCVGLDACPYIFNDFYKWNVKHIQLDCFYFRSLEIRFCFSMNGLFSEWFWMENCCNRMESKMTQQLVSSCDLNIIERNHFAPVHSALRNFYWIHQFVCRFF